MGRQAVGRNVARYLYRDSKQIFSETIIIVLYNDTNRYCFASAQNYFVIFE